MPKPKVIDGRQQRGRSNKNSYHLNMSRTHPDTTSLQQEHGVRAADLVICQTGCVSHDAY